MLVRGERERIEREARRLGGRRSTQQRAQRRRRFEAAVEAEERQTGRQPRITKRSDARRTSNARRRVVRPMTEAITPPRTPERVQRYLDPTARARESHPAR